MSGSANTLQHALRLHALREHANAELARAKASTDEDERYEHGLEALAAFRAALAVEHEAER